MHIAIVVYQVKGGDRRTTGPPVYAPALYQESMYKKENIFNEEFLLKVSLPRYILLIISGFFSRTKPLPLIFNISTFRYPVQIPTHLPVCVG